MVNLDKEIHSIIGFKKCMQKLHMLHFKSIFFLVSLSLSLSWFIRPLQLKGKLTVDQFNIKRYACAPLQNEWAFKQIDTN